MSSPDSLTQDATEGLTAHGTLHPRPRRGWINDPNGLIQFEGSYHVFFQHNPESAEWGAIHWGHMVSSDLVAWDERPIALAPGDGPDADGCWSGCAIEEPNGGVVAFYTGVCVTGEKEWRQTVCAARSQGDLDIWVKEPANPLIEAPEGLDLVGFRDPFVWQDGDRWSMIVGSGIRGVGGRIFRYESADLTAWTYAGEFLRSEDVDSPGPWLGTMWECPQLVRRDGHEAVLLSIHDEHRLLHTVVITGRTEAGRFVPNGVEVLDYGHNFYAPAVATGTGNRQLGWGWAPEARSPEAQVNEGWSGLLTAPRELQFAAGGVRLIQSVPEELRRAPGTSSSQENLAISNAPRSVPLTDADSALMVTVRLEAGRSSQVELRLESDGVTYLTIAWDRYKRLLLVARPSTEEGTEGGAIALPVDDTEAIELDLLIDGTIVELFTSEGRVSTDRVYPPLHRRQLTFTSLGGEATLTSIVIRELS